MERVAVLLSALNNLTKAVVAQRKWATVVARGASDNDLHLIRLRTSQLVSKILRKAKAKSGGRVGADGVRNVFQHA